METTIRDKSFNRDKSIEELQYDSHEWESKLKFIKHELNFLKFLLNINIFEKGIMNLFETIELFKQDVDNANKKRSKLLDKTNLHISKITKKLECVNIDNNGFFIEIHENLEHEFEVFLEEINNLKLQLFQYIQSVIKKRK